MKDKKFEKERIRLNELILKHSGTSIKRFMSLDSKVYRDGEVPLKYKELVGLAASLVMRCDDCIKYHLTQCRK
ncbi:MAG: carboxymuconolactone decarboxylase family protein, partial [bacterium]